MKDSLLFGLTLATVTILLFVVVAAIGVSVAGQWVMLKVVELADFLMEIL